MHFGGGSGAGVTVNPLGFLSIADQTEVSFVPIGPGSASPVEGLLAGLPGAIGKLKDMFGKKSDGEDEEAEEE